MGVDTSYIYVCTWFIVCYRANHHAVEVLLRNHSSGILSTYKDDVFRLKVHRTHISEDVLNYFK